jgi:hypothetical protein
VVNRRGTTVAVPSADVSRSLIAPKAGTKITAMWIAITIVLVGAAIFATASLADSASRAAGRTEIMLAGAPDRGIFDPSIAGDGRQLYMTVSGVSSTAAGSSLGVIAVRSYLARSQDQGRTWQLVGGVVNPDIEASLDGFPSPYRGRWQSEVTALTYDPDAPQPGRWKLFWHQYLNVNGDRRFEHGWLAYKEAEAPEQLASARPVKLITARGYDPVNDQPTGRTKPPLAGSAIVRVQELHRDLASCAAVSEPGVLAKPDALYLALICLRGSLFGWFGVSNQVVLLKCGRPCYATHPEAWSYAGTVLSQRDAEALGMRKFSAADLFTHDGHSFLIVSPSGTVPGEGAYKGCAVFPFEDLATGAIARDADGRPHLDVLVELDKDSFNGACAFVPDGPHRGLLIGQILPHGSAGLNPPFAYLQPT